MKLNNFLALALTAFCTVTITGCGSDSPEDVVIRFTKAMANEDVEEAFELFQWPVMSLNTNIHTEDVARKVFTQAFNEYWKAGKGLGQCPCPVQVARKILDKIDHWKLESDDSANGVMIYAPMEMIDSANGKEKIEYSIQGTGSVTISRSKDGNWRVQEFLGIGNFELIAN